MRSLRSEVQHPCVAHHSAAWCASQCCMVWQQIHHALVAALSGAQHPALVPASAAPKAGCLCCSTIWCCRVTAQPWHPPSTVPCSSEQQHALVSCPCTHTHTHAHTHTQHAQKRARVRLCARRQAYTYLHARTRTHTALVHVHAQPHTTAHTVMGRPTAQCVSTPASRACKGAWGGLGGQPSQCLPRHYLCPSVHQQCLGSSPAYTNLGLCVQPRPPIPTLPAGDGRAEAPQRALRSH